MTADSVVIEIVYPHPVSQVWAALTNRDALGVWLMSNDFEPHIGHQFTFNTGPQSSWSGTIYCRVVALEEPHLIAYTWRGGEDPLETLVTFRLAAADGGTRLRLEHSGFAAGGSAGLTVRDLLASGWNSRILRERLPAFLNAQADEAADETDQS